MVEKIQSKEKAESSGSSLNFLDLGSEIKHCCWMEPIGKLQSRPDVEDAAWVLFNMSLQLDDSVEKKKKKIIDPFRDFPRKKRSVSQNPKWVPRQNPKWVSPMEQLQCPKDMCDAAWTLFNMSLQHDVSVEKKKVSYPFLDFPRKKRSVSQSPKWVSPMEQLQSPQYMGDAAWTLFNMYLQQHDAPLEKHPSMGFPKKKRSISQKKRSIPQNPNLPFSSSGKMKLKIIFSGSGCECSPPIVSQSKSLIGIKRCLQIQQECVGGDDQVCKKRRMSKKPEIPQKVKDPMLKMGGSEAEARFVIQKTLQSSDTNRQQARLQIPLKQVENEFLSKEEEAVLEQTNQGIQVLLIQPSNNVSTHCLKKRRIGKAGVYQITNKWNAILDDQANGLTTGATIQIWSFRAQNHLCFAMVTL